MKDRLGVEIKPGDYLVYAGTAGRSSVLHIARVVDIVSKKHDHWNGYYDKELAWKDKDHIEKVRVHVIEEGFGDKPYSQQDGKPPRLVTLMFPGRMIVANNYKANG